MEITNEEAICTICCKWWKKDIILQTATILGTKGGCPWPGKCRSIPTEDCISAQEQFSFVCYIAQHSDWLWKLNDLFNITSLLCSRLRSLITIGKNIKSVRSGTERPSRVPRVKIFVQIMITLNIATS